MASIPEDRTKDPQQAQVAKLMQQIAELTAANADLRRDFEAAAARSAGQSGDVYRKIIETTSQGYWFISPELQTIDANRAFCEMLGYTRRLLPGIRISPELIC